LYCHTFPSRRSSDLFPFNAGDVTPILDEIERFLTGSRSEPVLDRMLATILFTDIVDSTRIAADRGDAAWLELLRRHDEIVSEHLDRKSVVEGKGVGA